MALRFLALLACLVAAQAIRQLPWSRDRRGCGRIISKSPKSRGLTFPLDVPGLLQRFHNDKSEFFLYLKDMGIDDHMDMSLPKSVGRNCLGANSYVIFMGDCMSRQAFMSYQRLMGGGSYAKEMQILEEMEFHMGPNSSLDMMHDKLGKSPSWTNLPSGMKFLEDHASHSLYLESKAESLGKMKSDLNELVAYVKKTRPNGVRIVIWMDALLQGFMGGDQRWTELLTRKAWQTDLVGFIRTTFPFVQMVWDSPSFVDVPLMKAKPVHPVAANFDSKDVMHKSIPLAQQDLQHLPALGVPITSRWAISNKYRGMQCDGVHATGYRGDMWNCPSFPAYEDMVLQSGLTQVCTHAKPVPLCQ